MDGKRVAALRNAAGLTQVALAMRAGLDPSLVSRIERGSANPTLSTVEALAQALGVTVADLLAEPATAATTHGRTA